MRTLLVILSKDQDKYAEEMNRRLDQLSVKPEKVHVILDRPALKEMNATRRAYENNPLVEVKVIRDIPSNIGRPQMNYGVQYFCAGHLRNTAAKYAIDNGYDAAIFIDGDCYPEPDIIKAHNVILDREEPTITVGRRLEGQYAWHDQREVSKDTPIPIFNKPNTPVTNEAYFVDSGVVWTCNMGINRAALEHLFNLNNTLFGRPELCSSDFCGTWGGEDGYIGLQALYSGVDVYPVCDDNAGVRHVDHERPLDKYDPEMFTAYLEEKREELMYLLKINNIECKYNYVPKNIVLGSF